MAFSQEYLDQLAGRGRQSGNYNIGVAGPVAGASKTVTPSQPIKPPQPNFVQKVATQTFDIGKSLAKAGGGFVANTARQIGSQAIGAFNALHPEVARARQSQLDQVRATLEDKQRQIVSSYKSGKMSKQNYKDSMLGLSKAFSELGKQNQKLIKDTDPQKLASDLAWTAVNVIAGGTTGLVRAGGKQGASVALENLLGKSVRAIENAVAPIPLGKTVVRGSQGALRELLERNAQKVVTREAQKMAGESTEQWLARSGKQIATGLLIKRPIFYQTNVGLADETYKHILNGDYDEGAKSAAWMAAQMVGGGPIGWFLNKGKGAFTHLGNLARGRESFIDELSGRIGNGNRAQIAEYVKGNKDAERTFRILQETNLQSANGKVDVAADNVLNHYIQNGISLSDITPEQLAKDMGNWAKADELAQRTIKQGVIKGIPPEDVAKYAVVRWDRATQNGLANAILTKGGNAQQNLDVLNDFADRAGVGWANNEILMNKLYDIIGKGLSQEGTAQAIKEISTASTLVKGVPKLVRKQLADLGYTIAAPFGGNKIARIDYDNVEESTRKLVSGVVKGKSDLFDPAHSPEPVMNTIATGLQKAGLSPESANEVAHQRLSEAIVGNLGELNISRNLGLEGEGDIIKGGRALLSELQRYVENKKGAPVLNKISSGRSAVTDIRQLTNREIAQALRISDSEAKDVSKALRKAYTDVPLELRGLGDKIVDYATAIPFSPMRYYLRAQSALRYTYNPFFRFQERFETASLAKMNADKFIWTTPNSQLRETVKELERNNFFSGNVFGSGADDNVIGRISANLTYAQKRNLAGLATTIAEGQGKTVAQLIQDSPEQLDDALRIIVQYPRKGALASPLARTINLAFFPMRYNAKVSLMAAEKLGKQPPSVQYAVIQGLFKAREWLKSDEGIQWQADNAEALKVWAWASPIGNIQQFAKVLTGSVDGIGDLGLLGGLPFGFISQILDAEGVINLNKPYVNPKTGEVLPDYIPQTAKAQAAVALQTFLGTIFSFPGRTLGLPGKEATIRNFVDQFIDTNGKDFEKRVRTEDLTPLQQNMVRVLKGDHSDETLDSLYNSPAPGQFNYYTLPPMTLPYKVRGINEPQTALERRRGLPERTKSAKGKKQKPRPTAIPTR